MGLNIISIFGPLHGSNFILVQMCWLRRLLTLWQFLFYVDRSNHYRNISHKSSKNVCILRVTIVTSILYCCHGNLPSALSIDLHQEKKNVKSTENTYSTSKSLKMSRSDSVLSSTALVWTISSVFYIFKGGFMQNWTNLKQF